MIQPYPTKKFDTQSNFYFLRLSYEYRSLTPGGLPCPYATKIVILDKAKINFLPSIMSSLFISPIQNKLYLRHRDNEKRVGRELTR